MIPIGTLDRITAIIGERGVGKSTLAKLDAREFQARTGGYVIGHSPNGQIGFEGDIEFHDSLKSLRRGLTKRPELMHFVATGATPEQVIDYARVLSVSLRKQGHKLAGHKFNPSRPAPKGTTASPILVVIDEGTHTDQSKRIRKNSDDSPVTTAQTRELEKFLTSARHEHIALTWLIQAPTARSWVYTEQSNRFRIFRYVHEWGLNAVRAAGIPRDEIEAIKQLPKYRYLHWDKEDPTKVTYRDLPEP